MNICKKCGGFYGFVDDANGLKPCMCDFLAAPAPLNQRTRLWDHMRQDHKLSLLESELNDIIAIAQACPSLAPSAVVPQAPQAGEAERFEAYVQRFGDYRKSFDRQSPAPAPLKVIEGQETDISKTPHDHDHISP